MKPTQKSQAWFTITRQEFYDIIRPEKNPEFRVKLFLYLIGLLLSPLLVLGALYGYKKAFKKYFKGKIDWPPLTGIPRIIKWSMVIWSIIFPIIIGLSISLIVKLLIAFSEAHSLSLNVMLFLTALNIIISFLGFVNFERWRVGIFNDAINSQRFGSAREATPEELQDLVDNKNGIYIGNDVYTYNELSHGILVSGTRWGKGTNIIVPNLLNKGNYTGSWVVLDPKGENAAICARYQKELGQDVIVLDPWELNGKTTASYNPLDLLDNSNPDHLSDDADIITEMIIPIDLNSKEPFFDEKSRSILTGLIIHLVLTVDKADRTLTNIWEWLRMDEDSWAELIVNMKLSDNKIVAGVGNDLFNMKQTTERTYGTIIAILQSHTDFLKSPVLQRALNKSSFNISDLTKGKTTLFVVIPVDKIHTNSKYLRLVTAATLNVILKHPGARVSFILDEFFSLGFMPQIAVGMSAYAGYNITLFPVIQNLSQLKTLYKDNWETFLSNSAIKLFTKVSDEFTMNYLANMIGEKTFITYETNISGKSEPKATPRKLFTPDEIRRGSANNIFLLMEERPVTYFPKLPYYKMLDLVGRFDKNPYIKQ